LNGEKGTKSLKTTKNLRGVSQLLPEDHKLSASLK